MKFMPPDINKLELQVKSHESRIAGLERSVDALKKPGAISADAGLTKRIDALEKTVLALQAAVALKKDAKTADQQAAADIAKIQAMAKAEADAATKEGQKVIKAAVAEMEKMKVDVRLRLLEEQVKGLLTRA
jgi:hypothetical protein